MKPGMLPTVPYCYLRRPYHDGPFVLLLPAVRGRRDRTLLSSQACSCAVPARIHLHHPRCGTSIDHDDEHDGLEDFKKCLHDEGRSFSFRMRPPTSTCNTLRSASTPRSVR